ncbi:MAG: peptide chain release factor N(5)-glutamine methyltransferase, partial [Acidobacteriota bacterium]
MSSKTIQDLFRHGANLLQDMPQSVLEAKVLLLRAARLSEADFFASPETSLSPKAEAFFLRLVGRRRAGVPLAYLTGSKEFWSIPLRVSPSVLIPRPETEVLVEKVLELSSRTDEVILDVGTGSGNIALALA